MRSLFLPLCFLLVSCAGSSTSEESRNEPSTDVCLADSNLSQEWGECNVKKTIYDNMDALRGCQAQAKANAGKTMMLKIRLRPNGAVRSVRPEAGSVRNRPLETCLKNAFAKVQFAAPPKGVKPVIYFPLAL